MSDDDTFNLDEVFRREEQQRGYPLSEEERDAYFELARIVSSDERRLSAFAEVLKARQGTIMPNFTALYKYKAELDKRLMPPVTPNPPARQS